MGFEIGKLRVRLFWCLVLVFFLGAGVLGWSRKPEGSAACAALDVLDMRPVATTKEKGSSRQLFK